MVLQIILYTFIAGVVGTGCGGIIGSLFKKDSLKIMSLLLAFAAGIMLAIVCFDLLPSSIEAKNIWVGVISTIVGVVIIYFLNFFIDKKTTGDILSYIIALHNIPEGMAIVAPLICGGMKKWKAVALTALSGVPTIFGALLGYYIGGASDLMLSICLGLASGAMLYVVFGEIIPQSFLMYKSKMPTFFIIIGIFVGVVLINII